MILNLEAAEDQFVLLARCDRGQPTLSSIRPDEAEIGVAAQNSLKDQGAVSGYLDQATLLPLDFLVFTALIACT